jgi:hypothetical protein
MPKKRVVIGVPGGIGMKRLCVLYPLIDDIKECDDFGAIAQLVEPWHVGLLGDIATSDNSNLDHGSCAFQS